MKLDPDAVVVATQNQVSSKIDKEAVILELEQGVYFGVSGAGLLIWGMIATPTRVSTIRTAIMERYDVEPEECARDADDFVQQLVLHGLAELRSPSSITSNDAR